MIANYDQLSIKQFLKVKTISDLEEDPILKRTKMFAEITGKSQDEVESMPIEKLMAELKEFAKIETLQHYGKVKMKFKVGGKRFECVWKTQELTAYQYIDATHFCKDQEQMLSNIHNILASVCVPLTWYGKRMKYDGTKHKEHADLFYNELKINQAYPIMLFFCKYLAELSEVTETFLAKEMEAVRQLLTTSMKNGDG